MGTAAPWQAALLRLCRFNRIHQHYPGRWRVCRFLSRHCGQLTDLPPLEAQVGRATFLKLDPKERFDGLKTLINGLNPREPLINLAIQILRPGDNAIDIGANVGYFSAVAALAVGDGGRVLSFEAAPPTYQRLQTLARRNLHHNVVAYHAAVADKAGELLLHLGPQDHSGTTSIRPLGEKETRHVTVPAVAIDDLLDSLPLIRLVKIDVEGAEMLVARGMERLLQRDKPYLLIEVTDSFLRGLGSNKSELVAFFTVRGYQVLRIENPVIPYEERDEPQCDVLMVPPGGATVGFHEGLVQNVRW